MGKTESGFVKTSYIHEYMGEPGARIGTVKARNEWNPIKKL